MEKYTKVNSHSHLLPYPEQIPAFMKKKEVFWIDDDRKYMRQKDWQRPITDPSFFKNEKLEWMAKYDIDHAVILTLSQLYCNGMKEDLCCDVQKFQNNFNASLQSEHSDKFTAGFVVQPAHIDHALREIERCVEKLGLSVLCLPTHFPDGSEAWRSISDPVAEPIFELANKYGIAIEIHPYDAPKMVKLRNNYWRFHLVWMCAQTADAYHMFTLRDFPRKYPNIRTAFAHGNQFGQINIGRRSQGFAGRPDLFKDAVEPQESIAVDNVYFDSIVHDVYAFRMLADRQGIGQVIAGLDDPYPLGEIDLIGHTSYPGKVIDDAVDSGFIFKSDRRKIWFDNVLNWIGGKRAIEVRELLKKKNESNAV